MTSSTMMFFESSFDVLGTVFEFLPLSELERVACVSRGFASGAKLRRDRIRRLAYQGKTFGETETLRSRTLTDIRNDPRMLNYEEPRLPTLFESIRPISQLRRLDLIMCRVVYADFRATMRQLRHTLRDLRIEMISIFKRDPLECMRENVLPILIDEPLEDIRTIASVVAPEQKDSLGVALDEEIIVMEALRRLDLSPPSSSVLQGFLLPSLMRLSSYRKMLDDKCSTCSSVRPSSKCGACKFYAFCARSCQMTNWNDQKLGHRRVCHVSAEADSPMAISRLVLNAARSGQLRELDLAHYWHQNVLFPSTPFSVPTSGSSANQENDGDEDAADVVSDRGIAVFAHPLAVKVFNRLVSLRLLRCGLDDNALKIISANSEQLRCLDISTNTKITDRGLTFLIPLQKVLRDLRLRQNYRLTDTGVRNALVHMTALVCIDIRCGIKRLRGRVPAAGHENIPANEEPIVLQRQIRITSTTSTETVVALCAACPGLVNIKIIATDDQNTMSTVIPLHLQDRVDCDSKGGIEVDEWGEPDDSYESWTDFPSFADQ